MRESRSVATKHIPILIGSCTLDQVPDDMANNERCTNGFFQDHGSETQVALSNNYLSPKGLIQRYAGS